MKALLLLAMICAYASAFAQAPISPQYVVVRAVSLSGSGEAVTIQQPASSSKRVQFTSADASCSVTCDVTIERDGTAATATAATIAKLNAEAPTPRATAFSASDVGTGTVIGKRTLLNGGMVRFDLNSKWLQGDGTSTNLTIRISSITGEAKINIFWRE